MNRSTIAGAVAALAGALVIGSVAVANATPSAPSPTATGSASGAAHAHKHAGKHGRAVPASAQETARVVAAVRAKDATVAVRQVRKTPTGAFVALGTRAGQRVRVHVSADCSTVTVRAAGHPKGHAHERHRSGSPVDAATLATVTAAVHRHDSAFVVEHARKRPDGSYVVRGTASGHRAMAHVSADLATVTVRTPKPRT